MVWTKLSAEAIPPWFLLRERVCLKFTAPLKPEKLWVHGYRERARLLLPQPLASAWVGYRIILLAQDSKGDAKSLCRSSLRSEDWSTRAVSEITLNPNF